MSRVEEALRRAAAQAADGQAGAEPSLEQETPAIDPTALAREPFPVEMPDRKVIVESKAGSAAPRPPMLTPSESAASDREDQPVRQNALLQRIDDHLAKKVVIDENMATGSREQYRRLAASLHHGQSADALKVVMIASAVQSEGKTLTATNLALTFSESYKRNVLLIDADLRRPTLHTIFRIDNSSGLSEGLTVFEERRLPVRQVSSRLAVLPAGRPSADPMSGLTSDRMRRVIEEARQAFDWVIIDTPPVVLLPDANLLGAMVDAAVLVVKAGSTSYDLVNRAVAAIGRERVLGVVLNRAEGAALTADYGYYSYYGAAAEPASRG
jgi:protein-tyrosine kinase